MAYNITWSTKILSWAKAPFLFISDFLFISVGAPCEFPMMPDVYILQSLTVDWYCETIVHILLKA